jgi:DNA-directed RNA polymerase specialized sigma24 family protein
MGTTKGSVGLIEVMGVTATEHSHEFENHQRLFWHVLSSLASAGFVVPPTDAMDLMHDFYVEAWPQVRAGFDSSKGSFSNYVAGAFYRFARRKITRMQHWRNRIVHFDLGLSRQEDDLEATTSRLELIQMVRKRIEELPNLERAVLMAFLHNPREARRSFPKQYKITRYQFDELLTNSLGLVSVQLGRIPDVSHQDYLVARSLWHEGRSAKSTALSLGITLPKVHEARHRVARTLMSTLRSRTVSGTSRSSVMDKEVLSLLRAALLSENSDLLMQVKKHRSEILAAIASEDVPFSPQEEAMLSPEWVAKVYSELGETGETQLSEEEKAVRDAVIQIRDDEEAEIGLAFKEALLTDLDDEFTNWESWFNRVPIVDEKIQHDLRQEFSVEQAQPISEGLVKYGMTPVTFFEAAHGVELLLNHLSTLNRKSLQQQSPSRELADYVAWLEKSGSERRFNLCVRDECGSEDPIVPRSVLISQVAATPSLPPEAALPLSRWLMAVAEFRPLIIPGYQAVPIATNTVQLTKDEEQTDFEIFRRWKQPFEEPVEAGQW